MQLSACQSLFGESFSWLFQLSVKLPNARKFHVAINRLRSGILGGKSLSSANCNSTNSCLTSSGGLSIYSKIVHSPQYIIAMIILNNFRSLFHQLKQASMHPFALLRGGNFVVYKILFLVEHYSAMSKLSPTRLTCKSFQLLLWFCSQILLVHSVARVHTPISRFYRYCRVQPWRGLLCSQTQQDAYVVVQSSI